MKIACLVFVNGVVLINLFRGLMNLMIWRWVK
jgi:hypothetical protein